MRGTTHPPRGPRPMQQQRPVDKSAEPQFPESCERALKSISNFVTGNIDPKFKRTKLFELQTKLDTDLFGLSSDFRQSYWQPMQRFKLLDLLCKFYMTLPTKNDAPKRYEYFNLIFCGREGSGAAHDHRMDLLTSFCGLAIQYPCYLLFSDVATWFMKIQSDVYAKRIIGELVEDFVLAPEEYNLSKDLFPLRQNAFEFACFFIVFSISEQNMCPQLIALIGSWFEEGASEILDFIAEHPTLRSHFKNECIKPMIMYDIKNSLVDDTHDKFHWALNFIILRWTQATRKIKNEEAAEFLQVEELLNHLISISDSLHEFQRTHLVQIVKNCYNSGFYSAKNLQMCISDFENCKLVRNGSLNFM